MLRDILDALGLNPSILFSGGIKRAIAVQGRAQGTMTAAAIHSDLIS